MPCTVNVNMRTVVHKDSTGIGMAMPDVCITPAAPSPIPIPYPNIALSTDVAQGTSQVKVDGKMACIQGCNLSKSTGDEAGSNGGVVSGCTKGKAEFIMQSFDVQFEGKGVCRLADIMVQNKGGGPHTPPMPIVQPPLPPSIILDDPEDDNELTDASLTPE